MFFHSLVATYLLSLVELETEIAFKQGKEGFKTGKNYRADLVRIGSIYERGMKAKSIQVGGGERVKIS